MNTLSLAKAARAWLVASAAKALLAASGWPVP